jgi:two-component system, sensor histidine kinase and response regulator
MKNSFYKKAKILIVDDTYANIELLEMLLTNVGFQNIKALTDSCIAIETYQAYKPDIILLDLMMPFKNGFEIMEDLKQIVPDNSYLPILVLTADIHADVKQRALSAGAKDFLSKPFDLNEVIIRIKNLLDTRYLHLQLEQHNLKLQTKVKERTRELEKANVELKIKNEQLEALDNAKLEFLNIISHEIRTPLNGIKGFTEILKSKIDSPQLLEYLNYLEISANRLNDFSIQALLIAQLQTNKYTVEIEDVNIFDLIELTKTTLKDKIDSKNIQVEFIKDVGLATVKADNILIEICFECLLDNAVKYSPKNTVVTVNAFSENDFTIIEFIDNGSGFSALALKNLFHFFGVGDKHIDKNNGLNLALVKLIMNAHMGEIRVKNNNPFGTTVTLLFRK